MPSLVIACVARADFSSWLSWRPLRASRAPVPRVGASAALAVTGADRDRCVEHLSHRTSKSSGTSTTRHLDILRQPAAPPNDSLSDQRVQDGFEPGELVRVLEDDLADGPTVDLALRCNPIPPALDEACGLPSLPSSSWTTASVEIVSAPSSARIRSASDFPAAMLPVNPISEGSGKNSGFVGLGLGSFGGRVLGEVGRLGVGGVLSGAPAQRRPLARGGLINGLGGQRPQRRPRPRRRREPRRDPRR